MEIRRGVIYRIWNSERGAAYIGSTCRVRQRWKTHRRDLNAGKHCNQVLQRAWCKYGKAAFTFEILVADLPAEDLHLVEDAQVQKARDAGLFLYNLRPTAASNLGYKHTAETRAKQSAIRKGRPGNGGYKHTEEAIARMKAAATGRTVSPETAAKISAANTGRLTSPETKQRISNALRGKKHSPEHCAAMSAASMGRPGTNKGRVFDAEFRAKVSMSKLGQPSYVRTAETLEMQRLAIEAAWKCRRAAGYTPKEAEACSNCSRLAKPLRRGRCHACNEYFRRKGFERPVHPLPSNQDDYTGAGAPTRRQGRIGVD